MASAWITNEEDGTTTLLFGPAESMIDLICECGGSFHECHLRVHAGSTWEPPELESAEVVAHIEGDWGPCRAEGFGDCVEGCDGC